ncbi:enoyl-CoA hydratase/isomerase family protein [Salinirubrum litoreum]|uniref:Enoyl-CoA hydratase/isomerase family protein n=1 Tax=Salinirubrum litoreum TaxID=1126234 RepID=A0ABD5RAD2_9EURY|nr:enoyl-CoA hydratase-related protein [Salinirubrum litoreum]
MKLTDDAGVRTITFDRPDAMNAMSHQIARDLADEIERADPDELDALVLTGEGRAFSAGGDVQAMADREETARESYESMRDSFGRVAEAAIESSVPVVARVNGDAVGAGMALVAVSDFAVACESARFGAAFVEVGLVPDTGGTFLLPQLVGLRTAKELAMTGKLIDAEDAESMGLINDCVPDEDLDSAVEDLLDTLCARPTRTLGLIKQALHGNVTRQWDEALDYEAMLQSQAYGTPEHEEGVAAFLEKRDPEF